MYIRCSDERKSKLESLTDKLSVKFAKANQPRRGTQLAFIDGVAKPPKSVARAQVILLIIYL